MAALYQRTAQWLTASAISAETGDLYDDEDDASEISLEVGAEAGPEFETQVQERLQSASVAQSGPTTDEGVPTAVGPQHSSLRRFSKDHAVSDDIQKRFMIAVEGDEKAAKKRVQEWLVRSCALWDTETSLLFRENCPLDSVKLNNAWGVSNRVSGLESAPSHALFKSTMCGQSCPVYALGYI